MNAIVLLSVVLAGQCGPSGCPAPTYAPLTIFRPPAPVYAPQPPVVRYTIKTYWTTYEGLTFRVRGYYKPETNRIVWQKDDEYNRRSHATALASQATMGDEQPKRTPLPVVRPAPAPARVPVGQHWQTEGVDPSKRNREAAYTAPSPEAQRFVQDAKAESDNVAHLHVTVVGSDENRAQVVKDLANHPAFAPLKPNMMVQDYKPEEWPVDPSLGFKTDGKPTILVQTAKGKSDPKGGRVVYRASDYSMGPEALAEAIRKADPDYKPSADPGPANGNPSLSSCPFGFTREHWPYILIVGIGTLILGRFPRKGV